MTIKDLKQRLDYFPDSAEVCFAPCDQNDNHWIEADTVDFVPTDSKHKICSNTEATQISIYLQLHEDYEIVKGD